MRNEYCVTWKLYKTWVIENMLSGARLVFLIIWCMFGCFMIWMGTDGFFSTFYYVMAAYCFYRAGMRDLLLGKKQYHALVKALGQVDWTRVITFAEENIIVEDVNSLVRLSYSDIVNIREKEDRVWIYYQNKMVVRLYKSTFIEGDWDACKQFMEVRRNAKQIKCVWEHNGDDTLLYAVDYVGAFTRGENLEVAKAKMQKEIGSYLAWADEHAPEAVFVEVVQEKECDLQIKDADSDVIFEEEKRPLTKEEYMQLKELALKSAKNFLELYEAIPDKNKSCLPKRVTFYGEAPRTAQEMYEHTKNVNAYYFGEIDVEADNEGDIYECRNRGFEKLEQKAGFLENAVVEGSYDELWSLRKVMRRFLWHDRIHAKAMYRMAVKTFGEDVALNLFDFCE